MDYALVYKIYFERFLVLVLVCYLIFRVFNKKTLLNPKNAIPSKQEFILKHNKKLDLIARICMVTYVLYSVPYVIFPALQDIPYVAKDKYNIIQCKTISHDNIGDMSKIREIEVVDINSGNKLYLKVNYTPIQENQYFTIGYLPHLKIGKIIDEKAQ